MPFLFVFARYPLLVLFVSSTTQLPFLNLKWELSGRGYEEGR